MAAKPEYEVSFSEVKLLSAFVSLNRKFFVLLWCIYQSFNFLINTVKINILTDICNFYFRNSGYNYL